MFIIKFILFGLIAKSICEDQANIDFVNRFKARYNDLSKNCLDSNDLVRPAYECSGILLRGVKSEKNKDNYAWGRRNSSIPTKAFSISLLRVENPFSSICCGYVSGFILYPHLRTPPASPENRLKVYCAFPLDGHTNSRGGRHGGLACGQSDNEKSGTSKPCHLQGINSIEKWISHFEKVLHDREDDFAIRSNQCGFDMTDKSAAKNFEMVLACNAYYQKNCNLNVNFNGYKGNELRIDPWSENCAEIPIEAFFYLIDSTGADLKAKTYRDQFIECGGRKVPIVGIGLPTSERNITIEILKE